MKAYRFRLDQALRWRSAQRDMEKMKVAVVAKRVADIRTEQDLRAAELKAAPGQLGPETDGSALELLSAFTNRTRRRIEDLKKAEAKAQQELAAQMQLMLEANRKVRLIENLHDTGRADWQHEFDRELEAFASDSFLGRLQSKKRACSSSG